MPKHTEQVNKLRSKPAPEIPKPPVPPKPARPWLADLAVCLLLLAATLGVYSQVRHYEFVNYDDPEYVTANRYVRAGLTAGGVAWAMASFDAANWFPLTWLSHMTDVQLFGLQAGWHHTTNVFLHALAALLLFIALKRLTGARWCSALVAFLFALHPLHVESVAWVAERKDVLSALFWCLTLWCYARYLDRPIAIRYGAVLLAFALGLMAKPMIVTLPFVLLLLDVWPLRRVLGLALVREKLPLFALAAGVSLLTFLAQHQGGAVAAIDGIPAMVRLENGLVSYLTYIVDMFWPSRLAVFYPYAPDLPLWWVAGAALVLAGTSYLVARQYRQRPYLAVGWCWYLGTLVPVIGLVQVGAQSHADRYTYLPMVGLSIMLAWGAADLVGRRPGARTATVAMAVAAVSACLAVTWYQVQYWANSETLFRHALAITTGNYVVHNNLANYYLEHRRSEDARVQVLRALAIRPNYVEARVNLGTALSRQGKSPAAEREYRRALELQSGNVEAHSGLGAVLAMQQKSAEALGELQTAVRLQPDFADGHYNLGTVLASLGRVDEAKSEFAATIRLQPDNPQAHLSMAIALATQGKLGEAIDEFAAHARLRPTDANAQYNLAIALARLGRLDEAIAHFTEALRLNPKLEAARKNLEIAVGQRNAAKQP